MTLNDADKLELPTIGPAGPEEMWDAIEREPFRRYDRAGNPISMRDMYRLREFGGDDYKRVAQDTVGGYWISSVWVGHDHQYGQGPPLIFETMVFKTDGDDVDFHDLDMQRYSTEEEALAGHAEMVEKVRLFVELEEREE